jgi:hypothetical protein
MSSPQSKAEIIEQLEQVQRSVAESVAGMSAEQFNAGTDESWSAAGYLKHLILSVKPLAKALGLGGERLARLFGRPERTSKTYEEIVALYEARLADGIRAEDFDRVTPAFYRFPDGVEDKQAYLLDTWNESNQRLFDALQQWGEADLDAYSILHPAIGPVTVREMLYFAVFHNRLHGRDIEQAGARAGV